MTRIDSLLEQSVPAAEQDKPFVWLGDLTGPEGNAHVILGRVCAALKEAGYAPAEAEAYHRQATSGDYDNLLAVTREWVDARVSSRAAVASMIANSDSL